MRMNQYGHNAATLPEGEIAIRVTTGLDAFSATEWSQLAGASRSRTTP
jgi:hypothetical protein